MLLATEGHDYSRLRPYDHCVLRSRNGGAQPIPSPARNLSEGDEPPGAYKSFPGSTSFGLSDPLDDADASCLGEAGLRTWVASDWDFGTAPLPEPWKHRSRKD